MYLFGSCGIGVMVAQEFSKLLARVRSPYPAPIYRAYSLMVKQTTHNRWSLSSILSGPTKYGVSLMDKTGDFYSLDMGSIPVRRAKSH